MPRPPLATEPTRIISAAVTVSEARLLRELAAASDRTASAELRRALKEHLHRAAEAGRAA